MTTDDRDDRLEELLRLTLQEEADTVVPSGDGLSRIQDRTESRRSRQRWLRPTLAAASVAVLAAVAVGAVALTNDSDSPDRVDVTPASEPATDTSSPSPTTEPIGDQQFPAQAIFPFVSASDEAAWQSQYDDDSSYEAWRADPHQVAAKWVQDYLQQPAIDKMVSTELADDGDTADVTLGRTMTAEGARTVSVTVVHLVRFDDAWIVIGADDPQALLRISSPTAGAQVTSPVSVSGPGFGVEETATIEVRNATSPDVLGTDHVSFGPETAWEASIATTATDSPVGVVVASELSAADGGPQRLTAEQVRFSSGTVTASAPHYFYGVKDQRVTKFTSRNGGALEYLTAAEPGGGATDAQLGTDGDLVYYLQGSGSCSNSLLSVSLDKGHAVDSVASPDNGYVISGYGVYEPIAGGGGRGVAYYEKACDDSTHPMAKLVMRSRDGHVETVNFKSEPPAITGDPSWDPDGQHVIAFVRTGTSGYVARYSTTTGEVANACPTSGAIDGMPTAVEVDQAGRVWASLQTGADKSSSVVSCSETGWQQKFTISSEAPQDVDVTADGSAALVTDGSGDVWRWDGSGDAVKLSPSVPLSSASW